MYASPLFSCFLKALTASCHLRFVHGLAVFFEVGSGTRQLILQFVTSIDADSTSDLWEYAVVDEMTQLFV